MYHQIRIVNLRNGDRSLRKHNNYMYREMNNKKRHIFFHRDVFAQRHPSSDNFDFYYFSLNVDRVYEYTYHMQFLLGMAIRSTAVSD